MSRIIFLDCDGVVCTVRSHLALGYFNIMEHWDRTATRFLRRICKKFDVKIVISSSWRIVDPKMLMKRLKAESLLPFLHEDKYTKDFSETRGEEIKEWLDRNPNEGYVIIDDNNDMLLEQQKYFVQTDPVDGMSAKNMEKILKILDIDLLKTKGKRK